MTHPRIQLTILALCLAAITALMIAPARATDEETIPPAQLAAPVAEASNTFAWELLDAAIARDTALAEDNLFFSPASIHLALLMTREGARGETLGQFNDVLALYSDEGEDIDIDFARSAAALIEHLNSIGSSNEDVELAIANSLWGQEGYQWRNEFLTSLADNFDAPLEQVDYITNFEGAQEAINAWTAEHTNDRIQNIIPDGMLNSMTRLVLVNAIYFRSPWLHTFETHATSTGEFNVSADETMDVEMMYQEEYLRTAQFDGVAVLEMPYADMNLAMYIVLPDVDSNLAATRAWLGEGHLDGAMADLQRSYVALRMPKFRITSEFGLNEVLQNMGLTDAFGENADFTGMSDTAIEDGLHISDVRHKAFVDVNEDGTEAAAATVIGMVATSMPPQPTAFTVDRPFMFVIRENTTGDILFVGQVVRPEYPEDEADDANCHCDG